LRYLYLNIKTDVWHSKVPKIILIFLRWQWNYNLSITMNLWRFFYQDPLLLLNCNF
jgi:hypothetical protein